MEKKFAHRLLQLLLKGGVLCHHQRILAKIAVITALLKVL